MVSDPTVERRRIAILDGDRRYDLALAGGVTLDAALSGVGVRLADERRIIVDGAGREVSSSQAVAGLSDGVVLIVVDPAEAVPAFEVGAAGATPRAGVDSAWWMLGAAAVLLCLAALAMPQAIASPLRIAVAILAGTGAAVSAMVWALRGSPRATGRTVVVGAPLALAFAAGVVVVPPLPAATATLAVFSGTVYAAVVAAAAGLVARSAVVRAQMGTAVLILLTASLVWGSAVLLDVSASSPAAVSLAAVPVALRALPATLLDVPPGVFIDYRRFQRTRWTVRQRLPETGGPIGAVAARELVDRSAGRLLLGTGMLAVIAAASAVFAFPDFDATDPIVLSGRIALACCATLVLLLGARRASAPLLRWMPRAAGGVVIAVVVVTAARTMAPLPLSIGAALLLVAGVATAFGVVPVGRGARSLGWSRLGDVIEWVAVVLSLPAGLVAADVLDLVRGMMAG